MLRGCLGQILESIRHFSSIFEFKRGCQFHKHIIFSILRVGSPTIPLCTSPYYMYSIMMLDNSNTYAFYYSFNYLY